MSTAQFLGLIAVILAAAFVTAPNPEDMASGWGQGVLNRSLFFLSVGVGIAAVVMAVVT